MGHIATAQRHTFFDKIRAVYASTFQHEDLAEQIRSPVTAYTDKTLEEYVHEAHLEPETFTLPSGGTFRGFMGNSIDPYFVIKEMDPQLYEDFNERPQDTIKQMYLLTDEPLAISDALMNGASKKLTDPASPQYLPNEKVHYHINNRRHGTPTLSMTPANGTYNMVQFNKKDWEDF